MSAKPAARRPIYKPALLNSISVAWPRPRDDETSAVLSLLSAAFLFEGVEPSPAPELAPSLAPLRPVSFSDIRALVPVGVNAVARALEKRDACLVLLCLPTDASRPLLAHLPPLASLCGAGIIPLSCPSPLLGHRVGLRTATAVAFASSAATHPYLAPLIAALGSVAHVHRPAALFSPLPAPTPAQAGAGEGVKAALVVKEGGAGSRDSLTPFATATAVGVDVPTTDAKTEGGDTTASNDAGKDAGKGGKKGGKGGNKGDPVPVVDPNTARLAPVSTLALLSQSFPDALATAVYTGPALRRTPWRGQQIKATLPASAAAGKKEFVADIPCDRAATAEGFAVSKKDKKRARLAAVADAESANAAKKSKKAFVLTAPGASAGVPSVRAGLAAAATAAATADPQEAAGGLEAGEFAARELARKKAARKALKLAKKG